MLSPIILLFAMGYDWGRWVNIGYVFTVCFYFYLLKNKKYFLEEKFMKNKFYIILKNKKVFTFI